MAKSNKEGWIRHRGGLCPVLDKEVVVCRMRDGCILTPKAAREVRWSHDGTFGDVMAYRIHQPAQQEPTTMTAEKIRIKFIENLEQIAALNKQNAKLVDDLRKIGFDFCQTPREPVEDMSDPKNWRVGDLLEVIKTKDEYSNAPELDEGDVVEKTDSQSRHDDRISVIATNGRVQSLQPSCFKFHSRPAK